MLQALVQNPNLLCQTNYTTMWDAMSSYCTYLQTKTNFLLCENVSGWQYGSIKHEDMKSQGFSEGIRPVIFLQLWWMGEILIKELTWTNTGTNVYAVPFLSYKKSQACITKISLPFSPHVHTIIPGYGFNYCSSIFSYLSHFAALKAGEWLSKPHTKCLYYVLEMCFKELMEECWRFIFDCGLPYVMYTLHDFQSHQPD